MSRRVVASSPVAVSSACRRRLGGGSLRDLQFAERVEGLTAVGRVVTVERSDATDGAPCGHYGRCSTGRALVPGQWSVDSGQVMLLGRLDQCRRVMLGYPCMNRTLREREEPLRCNRDMRKATFEDRGPSYAADLATQNLRDLRAILEWNHDHGIDFYRVTSTLVPWNSQFDLADLDAYDELRRLAERCGEYVRDHDMRLTFHPDYWCRLASTAPETVERSKRAVEYHADWLDLMGLARSPYFGVNVHIGATYDDRGATAERFRAAVRDLSPAARARLTVENDDEAGLWAVSELADQVSDPVGVPVVFDYHHHSFSDRGLTYREGFERAAATWDCRPAVHYSEPARLHGDDTKPQAHAEYVARVPKWLRREADVMLEAGAKERAVLRLRNGA